MISSSWLFLKHDFLLSPHSYPLFSPAPNSPKHLNPKGHPPPGYVELGVAQESGLRGGHGRPGGQHAKALSANGFVLTKYLYIYICVYTFGLFLYLRSCLYLNLYLYPHLYFSVSTYISNLSIFLSVFTDGSMLVFLGFLRVYPCCRVLA